MQTANRTVKKSTADVKWDGNNLGQVKVSTVFLGVDYCCDEGEPMLFETMVFGGPLDEECERCSTWEAAEQMHDKWVEKVKQATVSLPAH